MGKQKVRLRSESNSSVDEKGRLRSECLEAKASERNIEAEKGARRSHAETGVVIKVKKKTLKTENVKVKRRKRYNQIVIEYGQRRLTLANKIIRAKTKSFRVSETKGGREIK